MTRPSNSSSKIQANGRREPLFRLMTARNFSRTCTPNLESHPRPTSRGFPGPRERYNEITGTQRCGSLWASNEFRMLGSPVRPHVPPFLLYDRLPVAGKHTPQRVCKIPPSYHAQERKQMPRQKLGSRSPSNTCQRLPISNGWLEGEVACEEQRQGKRTRSTEMNDGGCSGT